MTDTGAVSLPRALLAGIQAGAGAALINEAWWIVWSLFGHDVSAVTPLQIALATLLPLALGGPIWLWLVRSFPARGAVAWVGLCAFAALFSLPPTFTRELPGGGYGPHGFTGLTLPMHVVAGLAAAFWLPKLAQAGRHRHA